MLFSLSHAKVVRRYSCHTPMKLVHVSESIQCIFHIPTTPEHRCFWGLPSMDRYPVSLVPQALMRRMHVDLSSQNTVIIVEAHMYHEAGHLGYIHTSHTQLIQCLASWANLGSGSNRELELRLVFLPLKFLLPVLRECYMWVCLDNTVKVKYISRHTLHESNSP